MLIDQKLLTVCLSFFSCREENSSSGSWSLKAKQSSYTPCPAPALFTEHLIIQQKWFFCFVDQSNKFVSLVSGNADMKTQ
jgi:hypothetical protein